MLKEHQERSEVITGLDTDSTAATVTLDMGDNTQRSTIEIWAEAANSGGTTTFNVHCSTDNSSWRLCYSALATTADATKSPNYGNLLHKIYDNAYRYVKVTASRVDDVLIEITGA